MIVIIIIIIIGLFIWIPKGEGKLIAPGFTIWNNKKVEPSPNPNPGVKTFKFDSTTDLKAELEKVNPEVLDKDFKE